MRCRFIDKLELLVTCAVRIGLASSSQTMVYMVVVHKASTLMEQMNSVIKCYCFY